MKNNHFCQNPKEWLGKAREDLSVAELVYKDGVWFGQVCYHSQQATEKYLKWFLTLKNIKFPKTHSLLELMDLCLKADKSFKKFEDQFRLLDAYYIGARYPMPEGVYNKNDAKQSLKFAKNFSGFIQKRADIN